MKLYVLEEIPAGPADPSLAGPPRARRRWWPVLSALGAAAAVGTGWVVLGAPDGPGTDAGTASAYVAPAEGPPSISDDLSRATGAPSPGVHLAAANGVVENGIEQSSIKRKGERVFIDLRGVDASSAIAMLSEATDAKVDGADSVRSLVAPLTVKLVASSPVAAWQSVFGDLSNFAVSCSSRGCIVHFVGPTSNGASKGAIAANAPVAPPPLMAPEDVESQALALPAPGQQTNATVYSSDY